MSLSYVVSNHIPVSPSVLQYLSQGLAQESCPKLSGILNQTEYAWLANGPHFQVINIKTGKKVASWTFGSVAKDHSMKVVCVEQLNRSNSKVPLLAIGLECVFTGGLVCLFNIVASKVLRIIEIKTNITSLHVIDTEYDNMPLPGSLRSYDGVLAVGTNGGDVLLVDLCRQMVDEVALDGNVRDEVNPSQIMLLTNKDLHRIEHYKKISVENSMHLAVHLNTVMDEVLPHFALKSPKGDTILYVNKVEVAVSALHYCPQLGSLLVGYNFGAFQLWNLMNMRLVYTSPVYENNTPITHFAIQEPSDDPRACCYIWALYSNSELWQDGFPIAVLYSFNYELKEFHEGYGYLYQDFVSCHERFQIDLTIPDEYSVPAKPCGGYCLSLRSVNKNTLNGKNSLEVPEDNVVLCSLVWTVWCNKRDFYTFQSIFDLNQWYKEQMPREPEWDNCNSYMAYTCISDLTTQSNDQILDVCIKGCNLNQFVSVQRLEEHYYPSSLSFDCCILRNTDILFVNNQGVQKEFLYQLESTGPLSLLKPQEVFQKVVNLGLIPLFVDVPLNSSSTLSEQRKVILSVALEQRLVGWLCSCATEWSNGCFSTAGCTLDLLLTWAWERTVVLKNNADEICVPLFDYSEAKLDTNAQKYLNSCITQLKNLHVFYSFIEGRFVTFVPNTDVFLLQSKKLHMVSVYFEVLQWLLNVQLLPESSPGASPGRSGLTEKTTVPYPADTLTEYYNKRRSNLRELNSRFSGKDSMLFIDNLIDIKCGGSYLQRQWEEDGGTGLYPPPSLQALLRTYLVENVDLAHKHSLVVYVFLDLAMVLNQESHGATITQLIKFPAVFKLNPSIIKITQAFWQLDHEDFSTAMEHLLDPLVSLNDLQMWHHRIVLRSLLAQKQHNFALLYLKIRQPPLVEDSDILLGLSLYISNNMLDEAFYFLKENKTPESGRELLKYLFRECDYHDKLNQLLYRALTTEEEEIFMGYLHEVNHPKLDDIKVFYNIHRSRFIDAIEFNHLSRTKRGPQGLEGEQSMIFRDLIIKNYKKLLPAVSENLMSTVRTQDVGLWKEISRPTPMSVFIHNTEEQAKYKSTLINATLAKAKETWSHPVLQRNSFGGKRMSITNETTPFLRTPKTLDECTRISTPIIQPRILNVDLDETEASSVAKRLRLSSRNSLSKQDGNASALAVSCATHLVKLDTPLVKRKVPKRPSRMTVCTPPSILKVRNVVRNTESPVSVLSNRGESTTPENLEEIVEPEEEERKESPKKARYGPSPRRSLSRTERPAVRFEDLGVSPLPDSSVSSPRDNTLSQVNVSVASSTDKLKISDISSKSTLTISEDSFYSPDSSFHSPEKQSVAEERVTEVAVKEEAAGDLRMDVQEAEKKAAGEVDAATVESIVHTPRSRRSYQRTTASPVRSSPRRRSILSTDPTNENKTHTESPIPTTPTKQRFPRPKGRQSLTQQVLTNNTINKIRATRSSRGRTSLVETSFTKTETLVTEKTTREGREVRKTITQVESKDVSTDVKSAGTPERKVTHRHSQRASTSRTKLLETTLDDTSDWDSSGYDVYEKNKAPFTGSVLSVDSTDISYDGSPAEKSTSCYDRDKQDEEREKDVNEDEPPGSQRKEEDKDIPFEEIEAENVPVPEIVVETEVVEEVQCEMQTEEELEGKDEYISAGGTSDPVMNTGESSDGFSFNNAVIDDPAGLEQQLVVEDHNFQDPEVKLDEALEEDPYTDDLSREEYFEEAFIEESLQNEDEIVEEPVQNEPADVIEISSSSSEGSPKTESRSSEDDSATTGTRSSNSSFDVDPEYEEERRQMAAYDSEGSSERNCYIDKDKGIYVNEDYASEEFQDDEEEEEEQSDHESNEEMEEKQAEDEELDVLVKEEEIEEAQEGKVDDETRQQGDQADDKVKEAESAEEDKQESEHENNEEAEQKQDEGLIVEDEEMEQQQQECQIDDETQQQRDEADDGIKEAESAEEPATESTEEATQKTHEIIKEDQLQHKDTIPEHLIETSVVQDSQDLDHSAFPEAQTEQEITIKEDAADKIPAQESIVAVPSQDKSTADVTWDKSDLNYSFASSDGTTLISLDGRSDLDYSLASSEGTVLLINQSPNTSPARVTTRSASQASKDSSVFSPRRKVLQKSVDASLKEQPSKPRTRSKSVDTPEVSSDITEILPSASRKVSLRKRSASVDQVPESPLADGRKPMAEAKPAPRTRKRTASITNLPVILEEVKHAEKGETVDEAKPKKRTRSKSSASQADPIQSYSVSRRLTRRQKSMLEKTLGAGEGISQPMELLESESEESGGEERGPRMKRIDPLKLLDKSPFKGNPDPDEDAAHKKSPSTITEASFGRATSSRCASRSSVNRSSPKSEMSEPKSVSEATTPKKRKGNTKKSASAVTGGRTNLRQRSVDQILEVATSGKRNTRKKSDAEESSSVVSEPRTTRSRTKSITSVKSDTAAVKGRRGKASVASETNLTHISEESAKSKEESTSTSRKRTRSKM